MASCELLSEAFWTGEIGKSGIAPLAPTLGMLAGMGVFNNPLSGISPHLMPVCKAFKELFHVSASVFSLCGSLQ